jgi:hypothetical protein
VRLSLVNELSAPLALIARHLFTTEEAAKKLQNRLASIRSLFLGSTALMGTGAVLAAPLLFAIDKAAELQKQLIAVQIATRGSADEMTRMRSAIEAIAGQTIFSNIDVAKMAKLVATGTGFGAGQVSSLLPVFARFADVQTLMKGTAFEESVTNLVRLAHTAQHYDVAGLAKYADLLTKASFIIPGGLGEVGHALKYSQGMAKTALGVDDENMVLLTALLNRLGLSGSRGGTNLIAAMSRTIPGVFGSGLLRGKSHEALLAMGMTDAAGHAKVFMGGKFDPVTWMGLMSEYVQREFARHPEAVARQDIMKNFQHAYGVQGSRVASLLGSPQALEQWRMIAETFSQYGGVQGIQQTFANQSVAQQYMNAKTNFISAMTELGVTLLPTATKVLKEFNTYMQQLIDWITKNPAKVKEYATNIGYFAIALVGLGAIGNVTAGIIGLTTVLGGLGRATVLANAALAAGAAGGGLLGSLALFTRGLGGLGLALGAGYAAGSVIYSLTAGTKAMDLFGEGIARLLALLGSQDAQDALDRMKYGPGTDSWKNRRGMIARGTPSPSPTVVHTQVNLDGRKIADVVTKHQVRAANAPQAGPGFVDPRSALTPAAATTLGDY